MLLYRYATIGQIEIEADSEEEADEKLNAMTPNELLSELGGIECFDVIDLDENEAEARRCLTKQLARRKEM